MPRNLDWSRHVIQGTETGMEIRAPLPSSESVASKKQSSEAKGALWQRNSMCFVVTAVVWTWHNKSHYTARVLTPRAMSS